MLLVNVAQFAALIRDQRLERGIAQERMATDIGVSRRWLIEFEQGNVPNPGFATMLKALKYLHMALDVRRTDLMEAKAKTQDDGIQRSRVHEVSVHQPRVESRVQQSRAEHNAAHQPKKEPAGDVTEGNQRSDYGKGISETMTERTRDE